MPSHMIGSVCEEVQIVRSIVGLVAVNVVDDLTISERSSKYLFHCSAVGHDSATSITAAVVDVPKNLVSVAVGLISPGLPPPNG